jgi:hypothetical protein
MLRSPPRLREATPGRPLATPALAAAFHRQRRFGTAWIVPGRSNSSLLRSHIERRLLAAGIPSRGARPGRRIPLRTARLRASRAHQPGPTRSMEAGHLFPGSRRRNRSMRAKTAAARSRALRRRLPEREAQDWAARAAGAASRSPRERAASRPGAADWTSPPLPAAARAVAQARAAAPARPRDSGPAGRPLWEVSLPPSALFSWSRTQAAGAPP